MIGFTNCQNCGQPSCQCGTAVRVDSSGVLNIRKPYICPKCEGEGTEDGSKRMALDNKTVMNCWPCGGSGIVWG